jgi:hypothetical protein
MALVEIIFKTFTRIGRGEVLRSNRNRCKAFVADISRTCLKQTCRRRVKTGREPFARNAVDFGTGTGRSFFGGGRTRRRLRRNKNGATPMLQGGATSRAAQLSSDSHTTPLVFKKRGCGSVAVSGRASQITEDFRTRGRLNAGITRAKSLAVPENQSDKIQRGSNDDPMMIKRRLSILGFATQVTVALGRCSPTRRTSRRILRRRQLPAVGALSVTAMQGN